MAYAKHLNDEQVPALDQETRERFVREHLHLVRAVASRFIDRSEPLEDLIQSGSIGLLKAVDRYDPTRQIAFRSYAVPFILGEIRHYLRDRVDMVRVPRPVQDRARMVAATEARLLGELKHSPTISEIAAGAGLTREQVIEARESWSRRVFSLDQPLDSGDSDSADLGSIIGERDSVLESAIDRAALSKALSSLSGREQVVIGLRFLSDMTQTQVAERLGCSQMQVSRLQAGALAKLRVLLSGRDSEFDG